MNEAYDEGLVYMVAYLLSSIHGLITWFRQKTKQSSCLLVSFNQSYHVCGSMRYMEWERKTLLLRSVVS